MRESLPIWVWPDFAKPAGNVTSSLTKPAHPFGASFCGSEKIPDSFGIGRRDYFAFHGALRGLHAQFESRGDIVANVLGEDFLKFHFKLSGNNTIRFLGSDDVNIRGGTMAVAIHPRGIGKIDAHRDGASENSLTFACRPSLFTETLQLDPEELPQPIREFAMGIDPQLYLRLMPLSSRIFNTINEMFSCPYSGRFSHIHAEARVLDLICMVLDCLVNEETHCTVRLTPRDVKMLEEIHALLREQFVAPPTIAELSRLAGMNRTKLTQGFRYLFGETILDCCQRLRMHYSRELLLQGMSVSAVAIDVGYEHHSSFAQAFKAYYGFPPVELRRRLAVPPGQPPK